MATVVTAGPGLSSRVASLPQRRPAVDTRARAGNPWRLVTLGLIAGDAAAVAAALVLAYVLRFQAVVPFLEVLPERTAFYAWVAVWALPVWIGVFALYRLYDRHGLFSGLQEYARVANACTAGTIAVVLVSFLDVTLVISRGWLLLTWLFAIALVGGARFVARRVLRVLHGRGLLLTPTVIVGANEEGKALAEQFLADPRGGRHVLGFVDGGPRGLRPSDTVLGELGVLGGPEDLWQIVQRYGAEEIVIASTALERKDLLDLYRTFGEDDAVQVRLSSGLFEILTTGMRVHEVSAVPLMTPHRVRITGLDAVLKTALDYFGAAIGLVALCPAFLVIGLLIKLDSPGPVFHRRRVLGRGGKAFDAFKFRTMIPDADAVLAADPALRAAYERDYKLANDPRVTRVGHFLRRTSLDELPQLVNVLRGEMSLVGPRMIAPNEAPRYGKWRLNLLTVKPGLTGPWQVEGRGEVPYEERVRLSMRYVRHYSLWLDLAILLRTAAVVLTGRGAY
jgi:exopolysaccharide biosynthesis polyprenyl glycosylphosphotransferase